MKKTPLIWLSPLLLALTTSLVACQPKNADEHTDENHTEHADEHEGEKHGDEHGEDHHDDHHHDDHHSGEKQVIPEGYTANFAVSNHPLLLLSEEVTKGTKTTVKKLLGAGDVGHHGSLSPSDIKAVKDSKHVVWFGKTLETNLAKTLTNAPNVVTILDDKNIQILDHRNVNVEVIKGSPDPHVWLEPANAKVIVNTLAKLHAETNPEHAKIYQENAKKFAQNLDELVAKKKVTIENNKYWSSHDAFQYLENSLNIKLAGALTTDHEVPAKASQIVWLKNNRPYETMCFLTQSEAKKGTTEQLKPVVNKVLVEDLSDSKTFLQAWEKSANLINECLQGK